LEDFAVKQKGKIESRYNIWLIVFVPIGCLCFLPLFFLKPELHSLWGVALWVPLGCVFIYLGFMIRSDFRKADETYEHWPGHNN
jgi:hypothetical protein